MSENFPGYELRDVRLAESFTCGLRIKRLVIRMTVVAFAWFMFLPEDWESVLGPLGLALAWVADAVPSINKMAVISPMPGAVRGVVASSVILAPIAGLIVFFKDCIYIRVRKFEKEKGVRGVVVAPLAGICFLAIFGSFMFWLPMSEVKLSVTPTRSHLMMTVMLTNKFFLAGGSLGWFCVGRLDAWHVAQTG